jgi:hypothetical protein
MSIDGNALIRALRAKKGFAKKRLELIEAGHTDSDIVKAMASATEMIDRIGSHSVRVKAPKYGRK